MDWDAEEERDHYDANWIWVDGEVKLVSDAEFEAHVQRLAVEEECEEEEEEECEEEEEEKKDSDSYEEEDLLEEEEEEEVKGVKRSCKYCKKEMSFKNRKAFHGHQTYCPSRPHRTKKCPHCGKDITGSWNHVKDHIHYCSSRPIQSRTCRYCEKDITGSWNHVQGHIHYCPFRPEQSRTCPHCGKTISGSASMIRSHITYCLSRPKQSRKCRYCGKTISGSVSKIANHINQYCLSRPKQSRKCPHCGMTISGNASKISSHITNCPSRPISTQFAKRGGCVPPFPDLFENGPTACYAAKERECLLLLLEARLVLSTFRFFLPGSLPSPFHLSPLAVASGKMVKFRWEKERQAVHSLREAKRADLKAQGKLSVTEIQSVLRLSPEEDDIDCVSGTFLKGCWVVFFQFPDVLLFEYRNSRT